MRHQSLLAFAGYRYLKVALVVVALAIGAYVWHRPPNGPYGGTWLGYTLGTISALLVLWLLYFGVRKRRYRSTFGTLQGWLSAHVYLGASLLVLATLHAAFQFGWNVHTLAYVLMVAVILSGFYGVFAYLRFPPRITDTLGEDTLETLLLGIADLDRAVRPLALGPARHRQPARAGGGAGDAHRRHLAPAVSRPRQRLPDDRRGRRPAGRSASRCAAKRRASTSRSTR